MAKLVLKQSVWAHGPLVDDYNAHDSLLQAFVAIGDYNGHVGLGVKCSKEVATAIRGAIILAKLSVVPVRRGYWGNKIGKPHTVPCKVRLHVILRWVPGCCYEIKGYACSF